MAITIQIYIITLLLSFLLFSCIRAFYHPGVALCDFQKSDPLYVKVNKLSSTKTPYDYYYLKYCKPPNILNTAENLEEFSEEIISRTRSILLKMLEDQLCRVGCRVKVDVQAATSFREKIDDEYQLICKLTYKLSLIHMR